MATVGVHLSLLAGVSGMSLRLFPRTSGVIANGAGGDTLTESGTGYFEATVAESLTGIHRADVFKSGATVPSYSGFVDMSQASPVVDEPLTAAQVNTEVDTALADYDGPTKAEMDAAIAGLAGSGARTVTITVNDGSTALEAANVRVTQGVESYVQSTNASGVATFNLDDATWTVSITKAGYTFAGASLVVSGTTSHTYSMTETIVAPPASPDLSAIEVLCLDETGQPESGVAVDIRIVAVPSGSQNYAFKGTKQTATSDGDGIARFEVVQGSTCEWKRGAADVWKQVVIDSDSLTNVTSVIGSP